MSPASPQKRSSEEERNSSACGTRALAVEVTVITQWYSDMTDWKRVAAEAWEHPGWKEAAQEHHRLRDGRVSVTAPEITDPWLARKQKERHQRMVQLERVLLGIAVHGPSTMHEPGTAPFVRWTKKNWQDAYRQIRTAAREEWLRRRAAARSHSPGCACWVCVLRLHGEAAKHRAELVVCASEGKEPW